MSKTSKVIITVWVTAMVLGFVALIIGGLLWRPILLPAIAVLMVGMVFFSLSKEGHEKFNNRCAIG